MAVPRVVTCVRLCEERIRRAPLWGCGVDLAGGLRVGEQAVFIRTRLAKSRICFYSKIAVCSGIPTLLACYRMYVPLVRSHWSVGLSSPLSSPLPCSLHSLSTVMVEPHSAFPNRLAPNQSPLRRPLVLAHRFAATDSSRLRWDRGGCLAQANVRLLNRMPSGEVCLVLIRARSFAIFFFYDVCTMGATACVKFLLVLPVEFLLSNRRYNVRDRRRCLLVFVQREPKSLALGHCFFLLSAEE